MAASKLDKEFEPRRISLIAFGLQQAKEGDTEIARQIADECFNEFMEDDSYRWDDVVVLLAELLVRTSQPVKLPTIIEKSDADLRVDLLTHAAATYTSNRQTTSALALLNEISSLPEDAVDGDDLRVLLDAAELWIKNGQRRQAIETLRRIQTILCDDDIDWVRRALYRKYYLLGLTKDADEIWKTVDNPESVSNRLFLSSVLSEKGERLAAEKVFSSIAISDVKHHSDGSGYVKRLLDFGEPIRATDFADQLSTKADNFGQQESYMMIADYHFSKKDRIRARAILDKAFARARTIKFEHDPMDSVGASSGSRKGIYLRNLYERFEELGDLGKALETIRAIDDSHRRAKEYLAAGLARFARDNARRLPRKQVIGLLDEGLSLARKIEVDEVEVQVMSDYAETLAKLRDPAGASDKLAELLQSRKGEYLEGRAILSAGEVYEKYKLPLTDRIRDAMSAILDEHE